MQFVFKDKEIFNMYINHIRGKIRTHQINAKSLAMYKKIINNDVYIDDLLSKYSDLIVKLLNEIDKIDKSCSSSKSSKSSKSSSCLNRTFLVNIVQQSLNSYGIINYNKLVYATKKENTKFL